VDNAADPPTEAPTHLTYRFPKAGSRTDTSGACEGSKPATPPEEAASGLLAFGWAYLGSGRASANGTVSTDLPTCRW